MSVYEVEELAAESADLLPRRETLGLFTINVSPVVAVNFAIGINAATMGSTVTALSGQWILTQLGH